MTVMCPIPQANGHDLPGHSDELVPSLAGGIDDLIVIIEHTVREMVLPQVLPDIFHRVEFWSARGQQNRGDVSGHIQFGRDVPAGAIHRQDGMGAERHGERDLVEMGLPWPLYWRRA